MPKQDVFKAVDELKDRCFETCRTIWEHPELSGEEVRSAAFLAEKGCMEDGKASARAVDIIVEWLNEEPK